MQSFCYGIEVRSKLPCSWAQVRWYNWRRGEGPNPVGGSCIWWDLSTPSPGQLVESFCSPILPWQNVSFAYFATFGVIDPHLVMRRSIGIRLSCGFQGGKPLWDLQNPNSWAPTSMSTKPLSYSHCSHSRGKNAISDPAPTKSAVQSVQSVLVMRSWRRDANSSKLWSDLTTMGF